MNVAPDDPQSKHLFGKVIDTEQVFVMGWRHGEQRFDARYGGYHRRGGVTPGTYNVVDADARVDDRVDDWADDGKDLPMTSLLTAPLPEYLDDESCRSGRPELRLVQAPDRRLRHRRLEQIADWAPAPAPMPRRRVSLEVRRRRTLLAMMGLALALLAFPLGGSGGASHTTGSVSAAQLRAGSYTVRAGDTLWSIAQRADPTGDPRPIVSQLAAQLGTYDVVPGELVTIP